MNKFLLTLLLSLVCVTAAVAQNTKANAKKLFAAGRYEDAKPVLRNLLKKTPKAGDLNYWYAVCCNETADTLADVERLLLLAVDNKSVDASHYLADIYKKECRYDEAIEQYEKFISLTKNESEAEECRAKLAHTKDVFRMMKTTEQVCVVDSFVVDKEHFLSVYKCGRDIGTLQFVSDYFGNSNLDGTLAETERKNDIYYSQPLLSENESLMKIFHSSKNGDEWSKAQQIKGFDTGGNDNYPFMAPDGTTFYFASDGEGSIGGYDIFVTRYNSERGSFLLPNNVGMPFNSEANDYMMVINEIANLGWFATDRRQPEGKVCVYVFIPNSIKSVYNYENEPYERMLSLSQLSSIADTHYNEELLRDARRQLTVLLYEQNENRVVDEFLFVIDDMTDYTAIDDFKSPEAKRLFKEWQQRLLELEDYARLLDEKRDAYAEGNEAEKTYMRDEILHMEQTVEREQESVAALEKEIRNKEIQYLNR